MHLVGNRYIRLETCLDIEDLLTEASDYASHPRAPTVPREEYERNRGKVFMTEKLEPSELLRRLTGAQENTKEIEEKETVALINEVCPKCSNPQMSYRTAQLRGADEGQTIFYKCLKCGNEMVVHS